MVVYTVGHGTLAAVEFADLVAGAGIEAVVDVRRFPGSRRHPHFSADAMRRWLVAAGIAYDWAERLGGRRSRRPDSPNSGLRNPSFRGFADYMGEPVFWAGLDETLAGARSRQIALLCAESLCTCDARRVETRTKKRARDGWQEAMVAAASESSFASHECR